MIAHNTTGASEVRAGADSVFQYLRRTAEWLPGGVRWQTRNDAGEPQYRGDLYSNGGIPLFLADYHRVSENGEALALAVRSAAWCTDPRREFLGDRIDGSDPWSLLGGRTGPGLAWLRVAAASGDAEPLHRAAAVGDALLARQPGPHTGLSIGAAGQGLFLLRLWERSGDARHLAGARRRGDWLAEHAVGTPGAPAGCHWPMTAGEPRSALTSICHGTAGVGHFFASLYRATGDSRYGDLARGAAAALVREARPDRGGLNWLPSVGAATDLDLSWKPVPVGERITRCQWCNGAPGVGLFFARAHECLGDDAYRATAEAAGEATYAYGDGRRNPTYCHGLAGSAELLVELFRVTGSELWWERAHEFARRMLSYRQSGPDGDAWPSDDPPHPAPDFLCGAAGTGHVYLRLLDSDGVAPALL